jgi:hypothetical protein
MGTKTYYCSKCEHPHRGDSKIGRQHLKYKTRKPIKPKNSSLKGDQKLPRPEQKRNILSKLWRIPRNIKNLIQGYRKSYRIGVEKYGMWWKIFQMSLWSFVVIFLLTAGIIIVVYLPLTM